MRNKSFFLSMLLATISLFYLPIVSSFNFYEENLNSDSVYMINLDTEIPVVEKNIYKKRSPASLTKIMTFIVTYENSKNIDRDKTKVTVSKEVLDMVDPESSGSKLKVGDEISIIDLLHCMMISSSGYAAVVLADYIGGNVENFVKMMNDKLIELGCDNTHFENPDGIYNENQYATAVDMSKIALYAMKNPDFLDIVSKSEYYMFGDERDPVITTNHIIDKKRGGKYYSPYVKGIKTGYIDDAGRCLISYASKDGYNYLSVVMGGPTKDESGNKISDNMAMIDTLNLYNWAFDNLKRIRVYDSNFPLTEINLEFVFGRDKLLLSSNENFDVILPKTASRQDISFEFDVPETIEAPITKDQKIGTAYAIYLGQKVGAFDIASSSSFKKSYTLVIFKFFENIFSSKIFIFIVVLFTLMLLLYISYVIKHNIKRNKKNNVIKISNNRK